MKMKSTQLKVAIAMCLAVLSDIRAGLFDVFGGCFLYFASPKVTPHDAAYTIVPSTAHAWTGSANQQLMRRGENISDTTGIPDLIQKIQAAIVESRAKESRAKMIPTIANLKELERAIAHANAGVYLQALAGQETEQVLIAGQEPIDPLDGPITDLSNAMLKLVESYENSWMNPYKLYLTRRVKRMEQQVLRIIEEMRKSYAALESDETSAGTISRQGSLEDVDLSESE